MNIAFPYRFDTRYRSAEATDERHIVDLLEQLLFTSPGERVNRPNFGSGLLQIVFGPTSPELAAATQLMMQGAIQQWMGELIHVDAVEVASVDATVRVTVRYLNRRTQQRQIAHLTKERAVIYFCCDENRRALVRGRADFNGIDYLEVVDHEENDKSKRQRVLRVFFLNSATGDLANITAANVRVTGGDRIVGIHVDRAEFVAAKQLDVEVRTRGDFSRYTLTIGPADAQTNLEPLAGMDRALSSIDFSFKVECDTSFDCGPECSCAAEAVESPEIDYLAKDYASFRQLILDRLSLLMPTWQERNPADVGITLVELLAFVGDQLSYRQDAIGTEAYLGTARLRTSVRRHARLLDYAMNDGCNARVWVQVRLKPDAPDAGVVLPRLTVQDSVGRWTEPGEGSPTSILQPVRRTQFATQVHGETVLPANEFARAVLASSAEVFEPLHRTTLYREHNQLSFYTWSNANCCLPKGAVKATLKGKFPKMAEGDVLVLVERVGAESGNAADANPSHRHAVCLKTVQPTQDAVTGEEITEIEWAAEDALPFPLCISSVVNNAHVENVSVALGNIVLADHGMTLGEAEPLGTVRPFDPALAPVAGGACGHCHEPDSVSPVSRFRPRLKRVPLTHASRTVKLDNAASALRQDMRKILPAIVVEDDRGTPWLPNSDLLSSGRFANEFVAEVESDLSAWLRFGDGENAASAEPGATFCARYRVGNGTRGNVGSGSITHMCGDALGADARWIDSVTNPLAAHGGADPQSLEEVRQYAPAAFRTQQRAVTPDDYVTFAQRHPQVQRAAATLRWTGSWYTVFLAIDRLGGKLVDRAFEQEIREFLEPYRMAGQDLEIDGPRYVSLELTLLVCIEPTYFRADVLEALADVFSNRVRPDGTRGFFHPDNFTFNQPLYLSEIYAAAQKVPGVRHVEVQVVQRQGTPSTAALETGKLDIGRLEIARLSNDPNFADHGVLTFDPKGGR